MLSKIHEMNKRVGTKKVWTDGRKYKSDKLDILFRSTWEVELAELMTELGIAFEYEPKRVYFRAERESYLPDFYLPEYNCWIEVKGYMDKRSERRVKLFSKYYGASSSFFLYEKDERRLILSNHQLIFTYIEIAQKEMLRRQNF